jgi:hypothetical protein
MDFVTEQIAIGDRNDAADLAQLQAHGITAVLNVARGLDITYEGDGEEFPVEYMKVSMIDGEGNLPTTFAAAVFLLAELCRRHDRVLVNCHGGRSRSASVICIYLATQSGTSFQEAVSRVQAAHAETGPNPVFYAFARESGGWQAWLSSLGIFDDASDDPAEA